MLLFSLSLLGVIRGLVFVGKELLYLLKEFFYVSFLSVVMIVLFCVYKVVKELPSHSILSLQVERLRTFKKAFSVNTVADKFFLLYLTI